MKPFLFKTFAGSGIFLLILILFSAQAPTLAAPNLQLTDFPTPTPGQDGRILYIVQDFDTLWRISAVSGVTLDELRQILKDQNFKSKDPDKRMVVLEAEKNVEYDQYYKVVMVINESDGVLALVEKEK